MQLSVTHLASMEYVLLTILVVVIMDTQAISVMWKVIQYIATIHVIIHVVYHSIDLCVYDISPVPCGNPVDGWIFNSDSGTCEFGGCRERGNVFKTMAECVRNCGGIHHNIAIQTYITCLCILCI